MNPVQGHVCPSIKKGALQFDALQAAKSGNIEKVNVFLDEGGDVNGGDPNGMTLIFAACESGRKEVVKELLKRPDLHLNTRHLGVTALAVASVNGHEECVKLLLGYKGKCNLNLRIKSNFKSKKPFTALCASAAAKHWTVFNILLNETDVINVEEVSDIFTSALEDDQWEIIQDLLQKDIQFEGGVFYRLVKGAYIRQLWDIIQVVFKRALHHDNYSVLLILLEMFQRKDWNNLESLLKFMTPTLKVDVPLAEALRSKQHQEVNGMLREKNFDVDSMSGNFLLACIGGASEEIAEILMSNVSNYSDETLKYALLLTSTYNRLEILTPLLQLDSFSYKVLNCAYNRAIVYESMSTINLLKFSLHDKACGIFPKMINRLKLDIANGSLSVDDQGE